MTEQRHDPITLEIIQNSLQAAADEMFAAMRKTAMSSIIYEVLDMGTAILDARGDIASSGAGIPAFIGVLDKSVKVIVAKFDGPGDVEPGDVFATNDPYFGGRHAPQRRRRDDARVPRGTVDRLDREHRAPLGCGGEWRRDP